jgi:hypothetical protein
MRSVSSSLAALSPLLLRAGSALACLTVLVALLGYGTREKRTLSETALLARAPSLTSGGVRRLQTQSWWGGPRTAATGELVTVFVSDSYPVDDALPQRWADFFAGLVHGPELQQLTAYVAPPAEVQETCGSKYALGCYGSGRLMIIGEPVDGVSVTPEEVARHEYGHHLAFNRGNSPWQAIDWGPKRWSSLAGICARVTAGTAFPGDEGDHYTQNPGEAFAETYRALNDAKAGATSFQWPIVDSSFYPDAAELQAVEQDVLQPWTTPTAKVLGGRFTLRGRQALSYSLATPLDGDLSIVLTLPKRALYDLSLLAPDGKTVLARGLWSSATEKRLAFTICGQRSLIARVTRRGTPGRFTLRVSQP